MSAGEAFIVGAVGVVGLVVFIGGGVWLLGWTDALGVLLVMCAGSWLRAAVAVVEKRS